MCHVVSSKFSTKDVVLSSSEVDHLIFEEGVDYLVQVPILVGIFFLKTCVQAYARFFSPCNMRFSQLTEQT